MLPPPPPPPTPSEWVAPGPDTLVSALDELEQRLATTETIARAASRWQNQRQPADRTCDGDAAPYLAFADAWHDAAQRSRVQRDRTTWLAEAPTLTSVRTEALELRRAVLQDRTEAAARSWMVFVSWHARYGPTCRTTPPLRPVEPRGKQLLDRRAIWLLEGVLCPQGITNPGLHLVEGPVCAAADKSCVCTLRPTAPGAVLTP